MRKLAFVLAIFLLLFTMVPVNAQITVDYPSNLRSLNLEVGEEYTFEVSIRNTSSENIQVTVDTEIEGIEILPLENSPILAPNQKISLPITFSITEGGSFSKVVKLNFIYKWENTTRKGTTCSIKVEGFATEKENGVPWIYALVAAIVAIILYIVRKISKR